MKKRVKKLVLRKETLNVLARPHQVVGGDFPSEFWGCTGSLGCPPPNCPSAPYKSCAPQVPEG